MKQTAANAALGATFRTPHAAALVLEQLREDDFAEPELRTVFRAVRTLVYDQGREKADPSLILGLLGGEQAGVIGLPFLFSLPDACPDPQNADAYIKQVRKDSARRQITELAAEVQRLVADGRRDPMKVMAEAQAKMYALEMREVEDEPVELSEAADKITEQLITPRILRAHYPIWWPTIRKLTYGLWPGSLTILAGESSHGKTAAALQIVEETLGMGDDIRVLYISAEMDREELFKRLATMYATGWNKETLQDPEQKATERDIAGWQQFSREPRWRRLIVLDRLENLNGFASHVRRYRPDLVVVDYLQLFVEAINSREEVHGTGRLTRALKLAAMHYQVPVIALSQLARDGAGPSEKPPTSNRLRNSGQIRSDADRIVMVWRKENEHSQPTPEGQIVLVKNRQGKTNFAPVTFGDLAQFRESTPARPTARTS